MCLATSFFFHLVLASFQSRDFQKSFGRITRCGCISGIPHILWFLETPLNKLQSVEISPRPRGCLLTIFPHEPLSAFGLVYIIGDYLPLHRQRVSRNPAEFSTACRFVLLWCDHGEWMERLGNSCCRMACDLSGKRDHYWKSSFSRTCGVHHHSCGICRGVLFWEIDGTETHRNHTRWCSGCRADLPPHYQPRRMDRQPDVSENF